MLNITNVSKFFENVTPAATKVIDIAPKPQAVSWYSSILPWLNADVFRWVLVAVSILAIIQIISNMKHKKSVLGPYLGFGLFVLSVYGVAVNLNLYFGIFTSLITLWLWVVSVKYNGQNDEKIKQIQTVPEKQPLKPTPLPRADIGYDMVNFGENDMGWDINLRCL